MGSSSRLLFLFLPFLLLFLPPPAHAAGPSGDLYLGYSRLGANTFNPNTDGLNGWEAAGHFHVMPFVGVEADVSHYGLGASSNISHSTTVLAGPRVTVGAAGGGADFRILPFFAWRVNADYINAIQKVYRAKGSASSLVLPVMN